MCESEGCHPAHTAPPQRYLQAVNTMMISGTSFAKSSSEMVSSPWFKITTSTFFTAQMAKTSSAPNRNGLSLCVIPVPYAACHYIIEQELQAPFLDCSSRTQGRRSLQTSSLGAHDTVPALASAVLDRPSGHGWKQAHGPPCAAHPDRCGTFLA